MAILSSDHAFDDILYSKQDHVARITINRPKQLNAFTGDTLKELTLAIEDAGQDRAIGVVVLTGAGDRAFCAGGDVNWEKQGGLERQVLEPYSLHLSVSRCPKPVIARVNGYAIGGGNHLAYYCDFTIAAEHAVFGQNGPRVGSPASGPIVNYSARILGHKRARELWMLCRKYTAAQMMEWGLVNAVVAYAELDAEVDKWCREILALSPTCVQVLKGSFVADIEPLLGGGDAIRRHVLSPDFYQNEQQEGARAFLEKRAPDFWKFRI
ncbi:MAG: enoyl-CoA hydratase/isomerase family protein [Burkholderiales bacterium]|nr:enoyl-CoA hydratase/isomerase family protein [Burkholderiales bacterium]